MKRKYFAATFIYILCQLYAVKDFSQSCPIDQSLTTWNGGTSERNLPGYYEWQSFTAGTGGALCEIDLMFGNSNVKLNGSGTLKIYSGEGINGGLLTQQPVDVNGTAYNYNQNFWQAWIINTPPSVQQGYVYTFQFIPDLAGGLPDPYIIVVNTNNQYAGGRNSQKQNFDNPFRTYVNSVLALQLVSFTAEARGDRVLLKWSTASEINTDHFEIEKSIDGITFRCLNTISTPGKSNTLLVYSYEDLYPANGVNYYRLKEADKDGTITYSSVIRYTYANNGILVMPNPSNTYFVISTNLTDSFVIDIFDVSGRLAETHHVTGSQVVVGNSLMPGVYFARLELPGQARPAVKLMKNK